MNSQLSLLQHAADELKSNVKTYRSEFSLFKQS